MSSAPVRDFLSSFIFVRWLVARRGQNRESLEITVEDEDRFVNDFLGFVSILMGDLEDKRKMRQW